LQIVDLNSSNGTFLNRDRLVPQVPHMLRNRAVLQLGRMMLRVKFA
jgi:pSer/pThr/pTyr-binding forkhead associated (FHA) protein